MAYPASILGKITKFFWGNKSISQRVGIVTNTPLLGKGKFLPAVQVRRRLGKEKKMDLHIKAVLNERFEAVKNALETYREAIESMVKELFEKETIDGQKVREIISEYEKANHLTSRLVAEETKEEA